MSTVSTVQAVLNSKQAQLGELHNKVSALEGQVVSLTSSLESWEARARLAEGELATCSQGLALVTRERQEVVERSLSLTHRLDRLQEESRGELCCCLKLCDVVDGVIVMI